jgi:hypothetical protein
VRVAVTILVYSHAASGQIDIGAHRVGETFSDWLQFNNININEICGKHQRGETDDKSICKRLINIQKTGEGEFYTADPKLGTLGWRFQQGRMVEYRYNGQWYGDQQPKDDLATEPRTKIGSSGPYTDDELNRCVADGNSPSQCLALIQKKAQETLTTQKPKAASLIETYFIDGSFSGGVVPVLQIENRGESSADVLIQRFSSEGAVTQSILKTVSSKSKTEVRLEDHIPGEAYQGWIKILNTQGDSVIITGTFEWLEGNTLRSVEMSSAKPEKGPLVQMGELPSSGVMMFAYVNLSDSPVHIGWCQDDSPCAAATNDVVAPKAVRVYPVDTKKKYAGVKADPAVHLSGIFMLRRGSQKTFDSTTSITFDDVK